MGVKGTMKSTFAVPAGSPAVSLAGQWVELPMAPTVNHYYVTPLGKSNVRILPREVKVYRRTVYYELRRLTKAPIAFIPPPLRVEIEMRFPTKARQDLDNRAKSCLDALRLAGMFEDDWQIDELLLRRGPILPDKAGNKFFGGQFRVKVDTIDNITVEALYGPHPPERK